MCCALAFTRFSLQDCKFANWMLPLFACSGQFSDIQIPLVLAGLIFGLLYGWYPGCTPVICPIIVVSNQPVLACHCSHTFAILNRPYLHTHAPAQALRLSTVHVLLACCLLLC
jgi:hypothetical protein